MSLDENKSLVRRFMEDVAQGDIDGALGLLADGVVVHLAGAPGPMNRDAFRQFGEAFHGAFADEQLSIEDQVAEGDTVVSRVAETARHEGDFQGIPASGKTIRMTGIWVDRIVDGKIAERWAVFDQLSMLQQMGVIPAPDGASA